MVARQDGLIAQMRRGTLQYCVLALLDADERYGFDLVRALGAVDGMVTSEGTIYPLLSRLRRDGLVESTWRESSAGPPRPHYPLPGGGPPAPSPLPRAGGPLSGAPGPLRRKEGNPSAPA